MKYAVISDVHANEDALKAVLADAKAQGAGQIVCLGDVVGYGPMPEETVSLVRSSCAAVVAGNHDDAVSGRFGASSFIGLAFAAVKRHKRMLSAASLDWLERLPYVYENGCFSAVHADFTRPQDFLYIETVDEARKNFSVRNEQLLFCGHTHVPGIFLTGRSGAVYSIPPQDFTLEEGKRYIVNPGSVGYPREKGGKCFSSYVLYDSEEKTVVFRFLPFSVSSVMQRIDPVRRRARTVAALVTVVALLAAIAIIASKAALSRSGEKQTQAAVASVGPCAAAEAAVMPEDSHVCVTVKLERVSAPAKLKLEYFDAGGQLTASAVHIVKQSKTAPEKIPAPAKGSARVRATLWRIEGADPSVREFSVSTVHHLGPGIGLGGGGSAPQPQRVGGGGGGGGGGGIPHPQ